jgi:RNA polymerase sigma-70 factor (sigma-E family)
VRRDVSRDPVSASDEEFRAFVSRHQEALLRLALLVSADAGTAEDLVQTAMMRTFARWDRFRGEEPVAYARKIIVNANIDRWRRTRGREQLTDVVPERPVADEGEQVADRDALIRALAGLSVPERRVIALRFLVDMSESDTAQHLGIPTGTVKSVTHRAIRKLREHGQLADLNEVRS